MTSNASSAPMLRNKKAVPPWVSILHAISSTTADSPLTPEAFLARVTPRKSSAVRRAISFASRATRMASSAASALRLASRAEITAAIDPTRPPAIPITPPTTPTITEGSIMCRDYTGRKAFDVRELEVVAEMTGVRVEHLVSERRTGRAA